MSQLSSLSHASVSLSWTPYGLTKKTRCPLVEDAKSVACQSQRQSRPQVETNMNLLHCQMFHSQSKGNCFVKQTYLFVKTIKISLSEQRFKKFDSLHINLKPFHKTPRPIFTFHAPSFEIHFTDYDIPSINEIKKTLSTSISLSSIFIHSYPNMKSIFPISLLDNKYVLTAAICWDIWSPMFLNTNGRKFRRCR